jgi:hypothetical protein
MTSYNVLRLNLCRTGRERLSTVAESECPLIIVACAYPVAVAVALTLRRGDQLLRRLHAIDVTPADQ